MATITATKEQAMTRKQIKIRAEIVQNLAIHALRKDDDATIGTVYSVLVFKHGIEEMTKAEMPTIDEYRATVDEVRTNLLPA
jgi:hypothetical protein